MVMYISSSQKSFLVDFTNDNKESANDNFLNGVHETTDITRINELTDMYVS